MCVHLITHPHTVVKAHGHTHTTVFCASCEILFWNQRKALATTSVEAIKPNSYINHTNTYTYIY